MTYKERQMTEEQKEAEFNEEEREQEFDIPEDTKYCIIVSMNDKGHLRIDQPIVPKNIPKIEILSVSQKLCDSAASLLEDMISDLLDIGPSGRIMRLAKATVDIGKLIGHMIQVQQQQQPQVPQQDMCRCQETTPTPQQEEKKEQ